MLDTGTVQQLTSVATREFLLKAPSDVLLHISAQGDFLVVESDWLAPDGTVLSLTRAVPAVNWATASVEVVRNARELADAMAAGKREKLAHLIRAAKN